MVKTFIQERAKWNEILQVNTENGNVKIYCQDKELGFPFSEYETSLKEMGYTYLQGFINRIKETHEKEVDTEEQRKSEIAGLLNLAKYRDEDHGYRYMILKDGSVYDDIVERLKPYGFTESEAIKAIENKLNK